MSRRQDLRDDAKDVGLHVTTRGGMGTQAMRYRFSHKDVSYFATFGIFTAKGLKEAETFLDGYTKGTQNGAS